MKEAESTFFHYCRLPHLLPRPWSSPFSMREKERTKDPLERETNRSWMDRFRLLSSGHQRSYSLMGPGSLLTAEEKSIIGG